MKKKLKKLESLTLTKFDSLNVEKMSRLKGGYTSPTVTIYGTGSGHVGGNDGDDGITDD